MSELMCPYKKVHTRTTSNRWITKNKLIEMRTATLVECTGDGRWGCSCRYNSKLKFAKT